MHVQQFLYFCFLPTYMCTCTLYSEYIIQRDLHVVITTKKATFQKHEVGHSFASPFLLCGRPLLLSQGRELYQWDYLRNCWSCYWFVFLSLTILCVIVMFILKMKVSNLCNLAVEQHDLCTRCMYMYFYTPCTGSYVT